MAADQPVAPRSHEADDTATERGRRRSFYLFALLFLGIIVIILAILATGLMTGVGERQFELAMTPPNGSIAPGGQLEVEIRITTLREGTAFFEHDLPVTLRAEEVPRGIYVTFNPAIGLPDPQFISRMLVAHAGAPPGSYSFTVRATGTDGRTLSLPFRLEVSGTGTATTAAR